MSEKLTEKVVGRPEKLTDEIKNVIAWWRAHGKDKFRAPAIRDELRLWLQQQNSGVSKADIEVLLLPGLSTIQKYLKEITPRLNTVDPKDSPWHIGALLDYNIPPSALPYIEFAQGWQERYPKDSGGLQHPPITIRQAIWISALHTSNWAELVKSKKEKPLAWNGIGGWTYRWSRAYAAFEANSLISGASNNTSRLDRAIRLNQSFPVTTGNGIAIFYRDRDGHEHVELITGDPELLKGMPKDGETWVQS